ncbi:MAG: MFS transporter [Desulfobacteraceae bacterium]|nr:MFS transporter [Desulfobacteraceae bacterium]
MIGVGSAAQIAKIPPLITYLTTHLNLSMLQISFLLSSIGLSAVVFGLSAVKLIEAIGTVRSLKLSAGIAITTTIAQALITNGFLFLLLRTIESLSHLMIVIAAPLVMLNACQKNKQALILGLWSTFFGIGFALMNFISPILIKNFSHESVFYFHAILFSPAFLLKSTNIHSPDLSFFSLTEFLVTFRQIFSRNAVLATSLAFMCHAGAFVGLLSFGAIIYSQKSGGDVFDIRWHTPLWPLVSLLATFIATTFAGKVKTYNVAICCLVLNVVLSLLLIHASSNWQTLSLLYGIFAITGILQGQMFTHIGEVAGDNKSVMLANGAFTQFGNLGNFIFPAIVAFFIDHHAWDKALLSLVAIYVTCFLSLVASRRLPILGQRI